MDKSIIISGNIAIITVAADVIIITSARFSRFRYNTFEGTRPSCITSSVIMTSWSIPVPRTAISAAIAAKSSCWIKTAIPNRVECLLFVSVTQMLRMFLLQFGPTHTTNHLSSVTYIFQKQRHLHSKAHFILLKKSPFLPFIFIERTTKLNNKKTPPNGNDAKRQRISGRHTFLFWTRWQMTDDWHTISYWKIKSENRRLRWCLLTSAQALRTCSWLSSVVH